MNEICFVYPKPWISWWVFIVGSTNPSIVKVKFDATGFPFHCICEGLEKQLLKIQML